MTRGGSPYKLGKSQALPKGRPPPDAAPELEGGLEPARDFSPAKTSLGDQVCLVAIHQPGVIAFNLLALFQGDRS